MKALVVLKQLLLASAIVVLLALPKQVEAQINVLDQHVTIVTENEPLTEVVKKICKQFNLDYAYNSKLIQGKRVTLNMSNRSVKEVFDNLMRDFYLIFEIQDNLLIVRDYVPLSENIDFDLLYNQPSAGFRFDKDSRHSITINFKLLSNLIVIPVSINGSDSLQFILDTGVKDPIITELPLVEKLNLNYLKPIELRGLGADSITNAYQSGDNTIKIPGITALHQKINIIINENFQISQVIGEPIHGLIGFDLFKNYIVKIDYQSQQIKLYKPQFFEYEPRKNDIVMPVHFIRNKPIIRSEIVQALGDVVPVSLLVDTGASDGLWLSLNTNSKLKIPDQNIYTYLGMGLGGDLFGNKGRVDGIWLGGKIISQPIASYPHSDYLNNIISSEKRHGTLGGEVLRRFTLYFDYFNKRIIFRPNSDFGDEFNYNMSGMEVINPIPGAPIFTINNIVENSPAAIAGLKIDDQIIRINSLEHTNASLNDINFELQRRENKKINMLVLRNGVMLKTSFTLQKTF